MLSNFSAKKTEQGLNPLTTCCLQDRVRTAELVRRTPRRGRRRCCRRSPTPSRCASGVAERRLFRMLHAMRLRPAPASASGGGTGRRSRTPGWRSAVPDPERAQGPGAGSSARHAPPQERRGVRGEDAAWRSRMRSCASSSSSPASSRCTRRRRVRPISASTKAARHQSSPRPGTVRGAVHDQQGHRGDRPGSARRDREHEARERAEQVHDRWRDADQCRGASSASGRERYPDSAPPGAVLCPRNWPHL